jgi:hypothetical protein
VAERDPDRIDVVVDALREAWKANPDMRLTQLVSNAVRYGVPGIGGTAPAHYNTEDGPVLNGLRLMGPTRG